MRRYKFMTAITLVVMLFAVLGITVSATYYEPDGSSSVEYQVSSSEANRTLIVNCVDESGNLIKKVTYHCKHGDDNLISLSVYGYDIVGFDSDQGLWETCKLTWASGTGSCTNAYIQIRYYFRTALSKKTMTATVTLRKSESIDVIVRHYTQSSPGSRNYSLHSTESAKTINYYDYISTSKKTITGYDLKDGYQSSISGNFSWTWVGKYQNMPSSPRCYSYDFVNTPWSEDMGEYSTYKESKDGKVDYCINRVCYIDFYYDIKEYTISFNSNGGTGAPASQTKYHGTALTLPETIPTRSGYTFKGWGTSSTDTTVDYQPGGNYTGNADRTLYAIWESNAVKTYTVRYNANGGIGAPSSQTKTHGVALTLSSVRPTRSGYKFLGWGLSSSASMPAYDPGETYLKNINTTLYAVWEKIPLTFPVKYFANGGSGAPSAQTKTENIALTLSSTKPTRSGYTFLGWSASSTATSPTYYAGGTFTGNYALNLYAVWEKNPPITYTISFNANGGSGAPSSVIKTQGVTLYLPISKPYRFNYEFLGWSTSSTATVPTYYAGGAYTSNVSRTLYAVWKYSPQTYNVYFNANGGSGAPSVQTKTYGVSLTLSSVKPVRSGYNFKGWATSSTATSASYQPGGSYTTNASVTLYAVWEKANYEFSISNLTVSDSEPYRYAEITVKVRTDSWDNVNSYDNIPVELYYDGRLMSTQYVDFSAYGIANLTFTLNVGDTPGNRKIEARINWSDRSSETNSENNSVFVTVNVKDFDHEVSIDEVTMSDQYAAGETVITSFTVRNDSDHDIIPDSQNNAVFTAYYYNGTQKVVISTQRWNNVVIPSGGANLIYFKWNVPQGLAGKTVYCECTINADGNLNEENTSNNTVVVSYNVMSVSESQTPNTRFESEKPNSYRDMAAPSEISEQATWNRWEYINGEFVLKKYGVQLSGAAPVVTPGEECLTAEKINGIWTMGAGYGFELEYSPTVSSIRGYNLPDSGAYTQVQNVAVRFPEFNYLNTNGNFRTLVYVNGKYQFAENPDAAGSERIHFIPVWFEDGEYVVSVTATQVWTPAGMITAIRNVSLTVDGTIYDDWYQS